MNDDDLRRLLGSIDGAHDDVPAAFADELWRDVRSTIVRRRPDAGRPERPTYDLVEQLPVGSDPADGRSWSWLRNAAVLVLLVAGVTGVVLMRSETGPREIDETVPLATGSTNPTPPPVLEDPTEACRRFEAAGPLAELSRRIGDPGPTVPEVPELDAAVVALEVYVRDLEAAVEASESVLTAPDVAPIRRALDSLQQAQLEVELGDLDRARRSAEAATSLILETPTPWC